MEPAPQEPEPEEVPPLDESEPQDGMNDMLEEYLLAADPKEHELK